ncbi:hypothetical protein SAMN04487928_11034 [Butyrivibrio proteoclasticus]|uniref:Uncharacterized protein n=1 Tax=Butyrivibrio proteoclasticus TaxID=43305 RepID=A0A1I5TUN6_9FIRM|nr:zinc ribbon domain-containing protein [Butyrivibrio proteoclasticus]SFP86759.1 hypothetical protein SAMN04487928_11034 [Butyrivibrio proteoclasticus]
MSLESMKCPECGAQLHFSEDQDFCFCSHCGTQVRKNSNNSIKIQKTIINRDEAKILEAENKIKEFEYRERMQKRKFKMILIIAAIIAIAIIAVIIGVIMLYHTFGRESFTRGVAIAVFSIIMIAMFWSLGTISYPNSKK